jgi:hypothetical protein
MDKPRGMVTLWPSFSHFSQFKDDPRLKHWGIRINSAMMSPEDVSRELQIVDDLKPKVPIWFDIKGRQLRIEEVCVESDHLELVINHQISVDLKNPVIVLLKQGNLPINLVKLEDNGRRLVFDGNIGYIISPGESIHICHPSLRVLGPQFTDVEKERIERVVDWGCKRYCLSFVSSQKDVDECLELIGKDCELILKIEDLPGLRYVEGEFKKRDGLWLMAAVGDLYPEIGYPQNILPAHKLIIGKDPQAFRGSRLLLTLGSGDGVPECGDVVELAWLWDIGYRNFLLCDGICFYPKILDSALNVLLSVLQDYRNPDFRVI